MGSHFHCYGWVGFGPDLNDEGARRPQIDELYHAQFVTSPLPPMQLHHWLHKRPKRTWAEPIAIAGWLAERYTEVAARFLHPDSESLDVRVERTLESLSRRHDVCWQFWLRNGQYASFYAISCPNRYAQIVGEQIPCPGI